MRPAIHAATRVEYCDTMATIMKALDQQKVSAIFVEHDVDIVSHYATRVAAWIAGRVAADGTPAQVLSNPEIRKNVIGE